MARILVVDDTQFMRAVIGDVLVSAGHEVVGEARNGAEAVVVETMKRDATDFVVKPVVPARLIEAIAKALG